MRIGRLSHHGEFDSGIHGVTGTVLGTEDKDVASGIAGLDGSTKLLLAQIPQHGATQHTNITREIVITANDYAPSSTCGVGLLGRFMTLDFDGLADESAFFTFLMPNDYAGGSINATIYGFTTDTSGGTVYFSHEFNSVVVGESYTNAESTELDWFTIGTTANILKSTSTNLDTPLPEAGDLVGYELRRDANNAGDSNDVDFRVVMIVLQYTATQ